jgi:hypothetical protein
MTLSEQLADYISACFTGLWIQTHEHDDALAEIAQRCKTEGWRLMSWDVAQGLSFPGQADVAASPDTAGDPLAALRSLATSSGESATVLVLPNYHRFLNSPEIVQTLARQIQQGKQNRTFVVILSPVVQIPVELEKLFVIVEHELPGREQLSDIARGVAVQPGELPEGADLERVLDASAGLTRHEAEGAYSLALVRSGKLEPATIWELKSQMLKKSGLVTLHRGRESFADLGGLEAVKAFCLRALRRNHTAQSLAQPKGILLLSPPGCGKSQFAKALGNETGRPTLVLDVGALLGSLVGQTEANIRQALRIADAMSPCILFIDEIEKALAGATSGGGDSGVSARLFGTLLTWLNDHTSDVFCIGTCNDISKLPPEFARSERFDGVFFVDLPSVQQRRSIWKLYVEKYELDASQPRPVDADWTGAEIKSCCRLASLLDVPLVAAAQNIVPVARTAAEAVERLRSWAAGRCLDADVPGVYSHGTNGSAPGASRRRVSRSDPSNN